MGHKAFFRNFGDVSKVIGTPLDKRRRSAYVQQSKCSKCRPLARTYAASLERHSSIALIVDHASCRPRRRSDAAASVRRHHVLRSGRRDPASAPISCSRLDSGLRNLEARVFKLKQLY